MFEELAAYYERNGLAEISHSRPARYEILLAFLRERLPEQAEAFRERLVCEFLPAGKRQKPSGFRAGSGPVERTDPDAFLNRKKNAGSGWRGMRPMTPAR